MIFIVVIVLVVALAVALVIAVAKDQGPQPIEIALAYEHAWDLLDFEVVYKLSGPELHDGLPKSRFVEVKRAAYANGSALRHLVEHTAAEAEVREGDAATVVTRLTLRDGSVIHHEVRLLRRSRAWEVVAYQLRPASAA